MMTTTTAAAGQVMRHLDFVHQCMHPEWDVSFISVTEQWAQFSIAGPKSQDWLMLYWINQLLQKLSIHVLCVCWCFRRSRSSFWISFSGGMATEVAVPSRYGESLFRLLVSRQRKLVVDRMVWKRSMFFD